VEVLLLPIDAELYAVPLASVREVMPKPRTTHLPTAPDSVIGLINVRGEIVPLFDVTTLIGTGATHKTRFATIVELAEGPAGLATSDGPVSDELGDRVRDSEKPAGRGVYRQGERLATLLDLETLVAGAR
jgi:purine-binding chemotaxis protein CheW